MLEQLPEDQVDEGAEPMGPEYGGDRHGGRRESDPVVADNEMPWQIRAIGFVGVPSAIALFLVWSLVSAQTRDDGNLTTTVNGHAAAAAAHAVESKEQGLRLERYLQLICVNTAKTDLDRTNCFGR